MQNSLLVLAAQSYNWESELTFRSQVHYNPKDFDFGGKKAFPLRDQHFFTSVSKVLFFSLSCDP